MILTELAAAPPKMHGPALRPSFGESAAVVAMMFFLAFSTPDQWLRTALEAQEIQLEGAPDLYAVAAMLGFTGFFVSRLAGNWRPAWWLVRQDRLLLSFFGVLALSTLWSAQPASTLRETIVLSLVVFFGAYLVTRFELRSILMLAAVALALGVLLDLFWVFGLPEYGDSEVGWKGVHPNKNSLGRLHAMSVIVFLLSARTFRRFRVVNYCFACLAIALVIGSSSATSLVTMLLASVVTVVAQVFRARKTLFGAVTIACVAVTVAAVAFATANLGPITDLLGRDVTLTGRVPLWEFTFGETLRRPLTGFGWNAYWGGNLSPSHEVWTQFYWSPPHSHNALIDYALQIGYPGAGLFLALFLRITYRSIRFVRDTPGPTGLWPLGIMAFSLVYSTTEVGVVFRNVFLLFFAVAAFAITTSHLRPPDDDPHPLVPDTPKGIEGR